MKKFSVLTIAFVFVLALGSSSCTDDETFQEIIDNTQLEQPLANNGDGNDDKPGGGQ
jgi:hypothetical protein